MIHLTTVTNTSDPVNSFFNGLQQGFATQSGTTTFSVDVFVLSGPVTALFFAGNGSTPILSSQTFSTTTNQWETLTATAPAGTNPNLFVLDSYSTSGRGEFYADNAVVTAITAIPEPTSGLLAPIGMSATALWVRKTRSTLKCSSPEPITPWTHSRTL
jgi:hypothetical protein